MELWLGGGGGRGLLLHSVFDRLNHASSAAAWDAYVEQFLSHYFAANPDAAVAAGRHEFDGKLPDWSDAGLRREVTRLKAERDKASAFRDEDLDDRCRFERDYLLAQIDEKLFWLEVADHPRTSPVFYSNALDPDVYVRREYAPLETRIKAYTAYARNVPRALEQIQANLKTPMPKTLVQIGRKTIGGLAGFYAGDVAAIFAPVKDEQLQKDFQAANEAAIQAVKKFDAWLATLEPTATDDYALGPEKFSLMLKMTEGVDIPLGRLDEIGKRDLQRNLDALEQECKKLAPDKTVEECMAMVAARKAEGNGPVDAPRGSSPVCGSSSSSTIWCRFQGPSRHASRRHLLIGHGISRTSISRDRTRKACHRPITFRRPTPRGPKRRKTRTHPGRAQLAVYVGARSLPRPFLAVSACAPCAVENRPTVRRLRLLRRLGPLHGRDDARRRPRRRRPGDAHRPVARRAVAQRAVRFGDRPAHARHDGR